MPKPYGKKMEMVRCLGPGREHTFRRPLGQRDRICFNCRQKMAKLGAVEIDVVRQDNLYGAR